jgi:hypothetical protein
VVEEVKPCPGILAKEAAVSVDDELVKLSTLLKDANKRKAFQLNPEQTMKQEGIDASIIPSGLLTTLGELSLPDLGVVSRANVKLRGRLTAAELPQIVQFPV